LDVIARTIARPGSRRRLLGGGIGGATAALGARLGLARSQDCNCGPGFECSNGVCQLLSCPPNFEPCFEDPAACCVIPDPCDACQVHEICVGGGCLGPIFEDRATCVTGSANGVVTRDVVVASTDGRLALAARAITERAEAGSGEEGRVHFTLAVNEGRTPQVQIDAVASLDHGITLTAVYGPAFAGVRTLTFQSEPGKDSVLDVDNRGAEETPALYVDPAFAAAAGELETALSGDLSACFAAGAGATPVSGSPVPDGQATCQTCFDVCLEEFDTCIAQGGPAFLSDPAGGIDAVIACTAAWERCVNSCPGGTSC
jgi:hypothetical protein